MQTHTKRVHEAQARLGKDEKPVLITGGAGFIGSNMAARLLRSGHEVVIYDNLSRAGVAENVRWLMRKFGGKMRLVCRDTRDASALREAISNASAVFHFAAQVAVTTSLLDPRTDFEVNLHGTLNVLEALRALRSPPPLLYTSTNKVYGSLDDVALEEGETRWMPVDHRIARSGVDEHRELDFHSPYGCSKGAADQYVLDYVRTFGLRAVVFRMSCIYGPRQFGSEDQGWVAHFLIRALKGLPITIFGDGKQVRDVLFVQDLVNAMLLVMADIERFSGNAFNVGGGPQNTISLVELLDMIAGLTGRAPDVEHAAARVGDQRYYVSDTSRLERAARWHAVTGCGEGIALLYDWLCGERSLVGTQAGLPGRALVAP